MRTLVLHIAVATYLAVLAVSDGAPGSLADPVPIVRMIGASPRRRRHRPVHRYLSMVRG